MSLPKPTKKQPRIPKTLPGCGRMKKTKSGKPRAKSMLAKADKLCLEYFQKTQFQDIAEGAVVCGLKVPCGGRRNQAHLKSRRHKTIRHDPLNYVCLSHVSHRFFTEHPDCWTRFIEERFPGRWERLNAMLIEGGKPDYEFWISYYQREIAALKASG